MLCLQIAAGQLSVMDPQPADLSTCQYVVQTPGEVATNPWALTPEQGAQIGGAILAVWGLAVVFREIGRAFTHRETTEES